ncbi:conjugal transfer protein [Streptomyces blastmyceticus]|uniref:Conjugative transposon protein TcpC n=1 Tax=Streptomyces blastmyceticus TaxID=68180 RepID=A0ABN0WUX8_9ACTN
MTAGKRLQQEPDPKGLRLTRTGRARLPDVRRVPWAVEDESGGARFAARFGRAALWLVVGLAVVTGVRTWFWPQESPPPPPAKEKTAPAYPVQEAQAVAARYARTFLTWDEGAPEARAKELARDLPSGTDAAVGWNAKGHQDVLVAQPGAVTPQQDRKRARVHVDVLVSTPVAEPKDKKDKPSVPEQRWVGLEVPVVSTEGRIVVTGQPGIVGVPRSAPPVPEQAAPGIDLPFSESTRGVVEGFVAAYANGTADSVTAPGASIAPLSSGLSLGSLQNWSADNGSGDTRTGTAVVAWKLSGAEITQTYRIELTRVSSASAARWQVAQIQGGAA